MTKHSAATMTKHSGDPVFGDFATAEKLPNRPTDTAATGAGDLSELPNYLEELANRFPEINPSNYDHDDVCALNSWGGEAHEALHEALREAAASRDALRAKDAEIERLRAVMREAREVIITLVDSRWSESESTGAQEVEFIDAALKEQDHD